MQAWLWTGEAYQTAASLPLTDRGFRYGMSLFETIRIWHSRPLFFLGHLGRLREACENRGFQVDPAVLAAAESVLQNVSDGTARIYVTAGDGPVTSSDFSHPRVFILAEKRPTPVVERCRVTILEAMYKAPFGGLKTANYWQNADALQHALEAGYDETLLFNENSELVSAANCCPSGALCWKFQSLPIPA